MNYAKRPQFIKDLPTANLLLRDDDAVTEALYETLTYAGFNPDLPVYTLDGDRVRLLAIDPDHQFPIVGEVIDFGACVTWLARWSASGVYASSSVGARLRHSLKPNAGAGEIVACPGCGLECIHLLDELSPIDPPPSPAVAARAPEFTTDKEPNEATLRAVSEAALDKVLGVTTHAWRPNPHVYRDGSVTERGPFSSLTKNGEGLPDAEKQFDDAFKDAVKDEAPNAAASRRVIGIAQALISFWSQQAVEPDAELQDEFEQSHDEVVNACALGRITREARDWARCALYVMQGRLRIVGPVDYATVQDAIVRVPHGQHVVIYTDSQRLAA